MWHNILGAGGVRELLWLERTENYAEKFLDHQPLNAGDTIVIFGHSGRNASGIDTAIYAKKRGLTVIAITAKANLDKPATHSSGKRLADAADYRHRHLRAHRRCHRRHQGLEPPGRWRFHRPCHDQYARAGGPRRPEAGRSQYRAAGLRFAHHCRGYPARYRHHLRPVREKMLAAQSKHLPQFKKSMAKED